MTAYDNGTGRISDWINFSKGLLMLYVYTRLYNKNSIRTHFPEPLAARPQSILGCQRTAASLHRRLGTTRSSRVT